MEPPSCGSLRNSEGQAMSNNRSTISIPDETWAAILDAVQRVIVDTPATLPSRRYWH